MARSTTPADLIIEAIAHHPSCSLDDVVTFCPELTWNQIFFEVDWLSRGCVLKLTLAGPDRYRLAIPTEGKFCAPPLEDAPVYPPVPTQPRQEMQCERCGGPMGSEEYDDFNGWRRILCREHVDPVILTQRRKSEAPRRRTVQAGH